MIVVELIYQEKILYLNQKDLKENQHQKTTIVQMQQAQKMKKNKSDLVCYCMEITYGNILDAISNGATTPEEVTDATNAGMSCGMCIETIEEILEEELSK